MDTNTATPRRLIANTAASRPWVEAENPGNAADYDPLNAAFEDSYTKAMEILAVVVKHPSFTIPFYLERWKTEFRKRKENSGIPVMEGVIGSPESSSAPLARGCTSPALLKETIMKYLCSHFWRWQEQSRAGKRERDAQDLACNVYFRKYTWRVLFRLRGEAAMMNRKLSVEEVMMNTRKDKLFHRWLNGVTNEMEAFRTPTLTLALTLSTRMIWLFRHHAPGTVATLTLTLTLGKNVA